MDISCATPTTLDSPEHVAIAEELGYKRAWFYDTPQQSPDVWMMLALTAQRTERIGLGPGVLVPSLRHPMVNAAATAALEALAPGRVAVAFGTGFSSRRAMGDGPLKWAFVEAYIKAFKGLLRGEVVEWEGSRLRMLHPEGHGAPRPVEVPVIIGALGPKGGAIAKQHGDGLIAVAGVPDFAKEFSWVTYLGFGTVLDEGEDPQADRVREAAGPATMITYHGVYEYGGSVAELPGGQEWLAVIEQVPKQERHLAVHHQHQVGLNSADQAAWNAGAHAMVESFSFSGTKTKIRDKVAQLAERGVTEIAYQPAGPDIRRELSVFMEAASVDG